MNFEKTNKPEQISESRKKLLVLEKEGIYVFHGSPDVIDILEPRQAYKNKKKDGDPAVFATPYADIAIFRALINRKDVIGNSQSRFGNDGDRLDFAATENLLIQAKMKIGRVYVLDRQKFQITEGRMQCRSEEKITPLQVIEVTYEDLPKNIKVIGK